MLWYSIATPLGLPVEPEVYRMTYRCADKGSGNGMSLAGSSFKASDVNTSPLNLLREVEVQRHVGGSGLHDGQRIDSHQL